MHSRDILDLPRSLVPSPQRLRCRPQRPVIFGATLIPNVILRSNATSNVGFANYLLRFRPSLPLTWFVSIE